MCSPAALEREQARLRLRMQMKPTFDDPQFKSMMSELWSVTHELLTPPKPPPPPYSPPEAVSLSEFLREARLLKFLPDVLEFGVESVHDLCDAVESGLLDDKGIATHLPKMTTVDVRKLRRATGARAQRARADAAKDSVLPELAACERDFAAKSPHWRVVGFYSDKPGLVDFRGAGQLGLSCLLHACRHHPTTAATLLRRTRLPFAAVSLNATLLVASLMGVAQQAPLAHDSRGSVGAATKEPQQAVLQNILPWRWLIPPAPLKTSPPDPPAPTVLPATTIQYAARPQAEVHQFLLMSYDDNNNGDDCIGFLELHSLALHAVARVAVDSDASAMDFAAVLAAAEEDLRALLAESLAASTTSCAPWLSASPSNSPFNNRSASFSPSVPGALLFGSSSSSPPLARQCGLPGNAPSLAPQPAAEVHRRLESYAALWERLRRVPGRRAGFVASPVALPRGSATSGKDASSSGTVHFLRQLQIALKKKQREHVYAVLSWGTLSLYDAASIAGSFQVPGGQREMGEACASGPAGSALALATSTPLGGRSLNISAAVTLVKFDAKKCCCSLAIMDGGEVKGSNEVSLYGRLSFTCASSAEAEKWCAAVTEHASMKWLAAGSVAFG